MKTYITINIIATFIFQFCLGYFWDITLKSASELWWLFTIIFAIIYPFWAHPLDDWIHFEITLHKERIQNRRQYELFKSGVKDGLFTTDEQVERENRRIVK